MPPRRTHGRAHSVSIAASDVDRQLDGDYDYASLLQSMFDHTKRVVEATAVPQPSSSRHRSRKELIGKLNSWNFSLADLSHSDLVQCATLIFEALWRVEGLEEALVYSEEGKGVQLKDMSPLLEHLGRLYLPLPEAHSDTASSGIHSETENPYHNFAHAIDVLQATYSFLIPAGLVPPISILLSETDTWPLPSNAPLRPLELFTLALAAVGHDVGHPGYAVQGINATNPSALHPLATLHSTSPLEHLHLTLFLQTLRYHGFGPLLDSELPAQSLVTDDVPPSDTIDMAKGQYIRFLLTNTILATDMARHDEFVGHLRSWGSPDQEAETATAAATGKAADEVDGTPSASAPMRAPSDNTTLRLLQTLLKSSDISNPLRPMPVPLFWSARLIKEWSEAARMERTLDPEATKTTAMDFLVRDPAVEEPEVDNAPGAVEYKSYLPAHAHISEANCQVFFVSRFLAPLLGFDECLPTESADGQEVENADFAYPWAHIPVFKDMRSFALEGRKNLGWWKHRLERLKSDSHERKMRRKRRSVTINGTITPSSHRPSSSLSNILAHAPSKPVMKEEHLAGRLRHVFPLCKPYMYEAYTEKRREEEYLQQSPLNTRPHRCMGSILAEQMATTQSQWPGTLIPGEQLDVLHDSMSSQSVLKHARRHSKRVSLSMAINVLVGAREEDVYDEDDDSGDSDYYSACSEFEDDLDEDEFTGTQYTDNAGALDQAGLAGSSDGQHAQSQGELGFRGPSSQDDGEHRKWSALLNGHSQALPPQHMKFALGFMTPPPSPPPHLPRHTDSLTSLPPLSTSSTGHRNATIAYQGPQSPSTSQFSPISESLSERVFSPFETGTASSARTSTSEGDDGRARREAALVSLAVADVFDDIATHDAHLGGDDQCTAQECVSRRSIWMKFGGKTNSKGAIGKRKSWSGTQRVLLT